MKRNNLYAIAISLVIVGAAIFIESKFGKNILDPDFPRIKPNENCNWIKRNYTRSHISFWEQNCPTSPYPYNDYTYFEGEESGVMVFYGYTGKPRNMIDVFEKSATATPIEIMKNDWYEKLTDGQKKNCEIRETQYNEYKEPLPHTVPHKVRYEIAIRKEVEREATNNFQDLPSTTAYDYLCGKDVGSTFTSFPPYFEFDDRYPSRYLMIQPFWPDGLIRLDPDTIQF